MNLFNKTPQKGSKKGSGMFGGNNMKFLTQITNAILVIIIISFVFSLFFNNGPKKENIPISQLASDISLGLVKGITVSGDNLDITYNAFGTSTPAEKTSQKEVGIALTDTLTNYKVPQDKLGTVKIDIVSDQGFWYWVLTLAPFLLPIIFIIVFIWYLTRQIKGPGMQALSFGQ